MQFFALPNLRSQVINSNVPPWEWVGTIPQIASAKKTRSQWINSETTEHHCYSAVEALNSNGRINKESNPPYRIHALVADYDALVGSDEVLAGCARATRPPSWYEKTLSGNARLVWLFDKPVMVSSHAVAHEYLKHVAAKLNLAAVLPGLDPKSFEPSQYWTNACEWFNIDSAVPISPALTEGWMIEVVRNTTRCGETKLTEIPLEKAAELLKAKYPQFEWPTEFTENSQGPSFWIEGSTSPKSAMVKKDGLFSFAAHSTKSFYSWSELLGKATVEEYTTCRIGDAITNWCYDGVNYWIPLAGTWQTQKRPDVTNLLKVRGISAKPDGEGVSDVDRALAHINTANRIEGVRAAPHTKCGIVCDDGGKWLQIREIPAMQASETNCEAIWGSDGKFPFISAMLERMLSPDPRQIPILLAWLKRAYEGGLSWDPQIGQALILVGGTGTGKTLFNVRIVSPLLGGDVDASSYLIGGDSFGGELFSAPLWRVDDAVAGTDQATLRRFTEKLKSSVANPYHRSHNKYEKPVKVPWKGRIICTYNGDTESIRGLPDLNQSTSDKLLVLRALEGGDPNWFPAEKGETERRIARELPYFARYLLDTNFSVEVDARYGIKAYQDPVILERIYSGSAASVVWEAVDLVSRSHFLESPELNVWEVTGSELFTELSEDSRIKSAMKHLDVGRVNILLGQLTCRMAFSACPVEKKGNKWHIHRPANLRKPEEHIVKL